MNIAIIEKGHFEVAYTLLSLFNNGRNKVSIYLEEESFEQLQLILGDSTIKYEWIIQKREEPNRHFISRMFVDIRSKEIDLLYINTIADNFIVYALELRKMKKIKNILTVHDINGFFNYHLAFNLRKSIRAIGKKDLLNHVNAFNVLSETMIAPLSKKLKQSKKIWNIPGSFFNPSSYSATSWHPGLSFHICIPGSIDFRRRDYFQVFELLKLAREENLYIAITLLGSFKKKFSETILSQCKVYQGAHPNLHTYDQPIVDQPEFDQVLNSCHFIWSPLLQSSVMGEGVEEQYGISTCSGNIADAIRNAKPCLVPSFLKTDQLVDPMLHRYKTVADIVSKLKEIDSPKYAQIIDKARSACLHYTINEIRKRNSPLFD